MDERFSSSRAAGPLLGWQLEAEHLGVERELRLELVLDVLGLAEAVLLPGVQAVGDGHLLPEGGHALLGAVLGDGVGAVHLAHLLHAGWCRLEPVAIEWG